MYAKFVYANVMNQIDTYSYVFHISTGIEL